MNIDMCSDMVLRGEYDTNHVALRGYSVAIIEDSILGDSRVTTMVVRFPRCVLSEFNTHRVFSRNSASSRARSYGSTLRSVLSSPYIPLMTVNQRGMSGRFVDTDSALYHDFADSVLEARDNAVESVLSMLLGDKMPGVLDNDFEPAISLYERLYAEDPESIPNVHKQVLNRFLEPFMWHEVVVTSSEWENFFTLRCDIDTVDPAMFFLANLMREVYNVSIPVSRLVHTPFVASGELSLGEALLLSASACASISYRDVSSNTQGSLQLAKRSP